MMETMELHNLPVNSTTTMDSVENSKESWGDFDHEGHLDRDEKNRQIIPYCTLKIRLGISRQITIPSIITCWKRRSERLNPWLSGYTKFNVLLSMI